MSSTDPNVQRDQAMLETKPLGEMDDSQGDEQTFVSRCIEAQSFAEYLTETDTDAENTSLPHTRRWTNFLLHLYETLIHREDPSTKSREGRRLLARSWSQKSSRQSWKPVEPPQLETELYERGEGAFCVGAVGAGRGPGHTLDSGPSPLWMGLLRTREMELER
ncbi:hypothetical protein N7478_001402 [Penicillium angulare]|uniref:uncharacterized protein n=1 Tax=Penicillium angulare TaxID=116970 RepID=UPI002541848F|nr:uncharacterized protein N7478_001402 [Penicillium angulare]KAJ5292151.1 hypothetical protein N7478_001402 [Penicillium angulare]